MVQPFRVTLISDCEGVIVVVAGVAIHCRQFLGGGGARASSRLVRARSRSLVAAARPRAS